MTPPDAADCPACGKVNPCGDPRCPKCRAPVKEGWKACAACGFRLEIACPKCAKPVFFGDYCSACGARLTVICPHCGEEQPPVSDKCRKCGKKPGGK
jgi:ribosomal protein L40E